MDNVAAAEDALVSGSSPTILFVEDHADTLDVIGRLMRSYGYTPILAASYAAAMKVADAQQNIDVVIADLLLPDGDGADLFCELKKRWPDMCGICLSACGMPADIERSQAAGFACHLTKPVKFETLHKALHEVCPVIR